MEDEKVARELGEFSVRIANLESRISALETKLWLALIGVLSAVGKTGFDVIVTAMKGGGQ